MTMPPTITPESSSASLATCLRAELLALPFAAFATCMGRLLEQLGYTQVQLAGRTTWKGRNQFGGGSGFDLVAFAPHSVSKRHVVVSIKPFPPEQTLYQRTLDELRGACLRVGASEALLLTTATVSPAVRTPQAALLAPVAVLQGDELLALLIHHRVGVVEEEGYLKLDHALFTQLRAESQKGASDAPAAQRATPPHGRHSVGSPLRVQVVVALLPGAAGKRGTK